MMGVRSPVVGILCVAVLLLAGRQLHIERKLHDPSSRRLSAVADPDEGSGAGAAPAYCPPLPALRTPKAFAEMDVQELSAWLEGSPTLAKLAPAVREHEIDAAALGLLSPRDLTVAAGVQLGAAAKLKGGAEELLARAAPATLAEERDPTSHTGTDAMPISSSSDDRPQLYRYEHELNDWAPAASGPLRRPRDRGHGDRVLRGGRGRGSPPYAERRGLRGAAVHVHSRMRRAVRPVLRQLRRGRDRPRRPGWLRSAVWAVPGGGFPARPMPGRANLGL